MGLLSFLQRKQQQKARPEGRSSASDTADAVQRARTRSRQRLIGAVVLLAVGVIGFPLLFETQPRPIPVDIPIQIPQRDSVAPLPMPTPRPSARAGASAPVPDVITETAADAGREVGPAPAASTAPAVAQAAPTASAPSHTKPPASPREQTAAATPRPSEDTNRARSLLNGQPTASVASAPAADAAKGRFVVQVGAFSEANAARDARGKVEKLGLKTYTQVVDTEAGKRIRVRVGPFASREEADRASSRIKSAGLPSAILTL